MSPLSFLLYFKVLKIKTTKYSESWSWVFRGRGKLRLAGPRFSVDPQCTVREGPGMATTLVVRADIVDFSLGYFTRLSSSTVGSRTLPPCLWPQLLRAALGSRPPAGWLYLGPSHGVSP